MGQEEERRTARVTVTELNDFLRTPPRGFSVTKTESEPLRCIVRGDPDTNLLLADPCETSAGSVVFHGSLGRNVTLRNLWQYSDFRRSLVSKNLFLVVAARTSQFAEEVARHYVVCVHGANPVVRWHMDAALDQAISTVAGESYVMEVDLTKTLDVWAARNMAGSRPEWVNASFVLKYHSDALFDFPYWLGFSKRKFELQLI
ncbi:mesenteric estrogen-dependent adipogenesis protein-like [Corythoichthys intestinalis]|uniref:mesenteric estrogen-dependent adipogenesis protein-like n=1 Tax=Corythoichthys intestinalis TaxID=161448 RepID=UPI0025A5892B|nr:mesenteric estrogen-dependent adipogenesis protein-like [Corythoichthys intestinalis]